MILEMDGNYFSSSTGTVDSLQSWFSYNIGTPIILELSNVNIPNKTALRITKNTATEQFIEAFKGATLTILTQDVVTN